MDHHDNVEELFSQILDRPEAELEITMEMDPDIGGESLDVFLVLEDVKFEDDKIKVKVRPA